MSNQPSTFDNERCSTLELTATKEIIERLKAVKQENELTIPRIKEMMERNGDFVSMSTLRRVFSDNDDESFSYDRTIAPIARALLFQENEETTEALPDDKLEGLRQIILLKTEQIYQLTDQLEDLKKQIELKDKRMDEKDQLIKRLLDKCL